MTTYLVTWAGAHQPEQVMDADSPEDAARQAVERCDFNEWVDGVEVAVWERVLTRHDVILEDV